MEQPKEFYRLYDRHCIDGIRVTLEKFYEVKKTPAGTWVRSQYAPCWMDADFKYLKKHKYLKFILDNSLRKHCYPTLEGAIESFKHRKRKQQAMLRHQLEQVDVCVNNLDKLDSVDVQSFTCASKYGESGVLLGKTASHSDFLSDY